MRRKRRTYQFGWLERQERNGRPAMWLYRYREMNAEGHYRKRCITLGSVEEFPSEALAWRAAEHLRLHANRANPQARIPTVQAVADRYRNEVLPHRTRLSTRTFYRPWLDRYILPQWGAYRLSDVRILAVEEWLNGLELKKKSKQHIRSLLQRLFHYAMKWELVELGENPMRNVDIFDDEEDASQKRVLSPAEFQAILQELPEPYRMMAVLGCCLGLRVSEILGLQWQDFRWKELELKVERAVVLGEVGRVKTKKSKSVLPLDPELATTLLEFERRTAPEDLPTSWVFANPSRGTPWRPSHIQQTYVRPAGRKVLGEDGLGWHNLRHTFSSMLRSLGTDIKVQQELLRHADVRTTLNIYTQAPSVEKRAAASRVRLAMLEPVVGWKQ
jgi:integrase